MKDVADIAQIAAKNLIKPTKRLPSGSLFLCRERRPRRPLENFYVTGQPGAVSYYAQTPPGDVPAQINDRLCEKGSPGGELSPKVTEG